MYLEWKNGRYTSIRLFDDYVHLAVGMPSGTCSTSGSCGSYLVVEGDGALYPCDFYCLDQWELGEIGQKSLEAFLNGEKEQAFLDGGQNYPAACPSRSLSFGGCKRDWYTDPTGTHNYFCPAFRRFSQHASPWLAEIARVEAALRR